MFCINCGNMINEGERICKGCGQLSASVRDELLAMSEKQSDLKCKKCGGDIKAEHRHCSKCGEPTTC